jgi:hypothetical protein
MSKSRSTTRKTLAPPTVKGVYKEMPITIYGEYHDNINNTFYKKLNLKDAIVLVEHSTKFCQLQPDEEHLFANAQGTEYIWFTRTKDNQPVVCIDTRLEQGFLNRFEENLLQHGETVTLEALLMKTRQIIMATMAIKDNFLPIKELYTQLIEETKTQFKQMMVNVKTGERDESLIEHLIANLLMLSNLSVDMTILKKLDEYAAAGNRDEIIIFVGANHAERLKEFLGLKGGKKLKRKSKKKTKKIKKNSI